MTDDKPASTTWRVVATRNSYECNRDHDAELLKRLLDGSPFSPEGERVDEEFRLEMDNDTLKIIDERGRTRLEFSDIEWSPVSFDIAREHLVDVKPRVSHLEFDEINWKWRIRSRFCDAHHNDETIEDILADEAHCWIISGDGEALVPPELNFHINLGVPCTVQLSCGQTCEFDPRDDWEFFGCAQNALDEKEYLFAGDDCVMVVTDVRAGAFPTALELTMSEALGLSGLQHGEIGPCNHSDEPLRLVPTAEETDSPTADDGEASLNATLEKDAATAEATLVGSGSLPELAQAIESESESRPMPHSGGNRTLPVSDPAGESVDRGALNEKNRTQQTEAKANDSESTLSCSSSERDQATGDSDPRQVVPSDLVRLSQAAAIVARRKRTLERWQQRDEMFPLPVSQGGGGKPSFWSWAEIRPYLERKANMSLPERFPGHGE